MKTMKLAAVLMLMLALSACGTLTNAFSTKPEDMTALRLTIDKQQQALDLAFELHKKSLQEMHDMGLDEAYGRIGQAALDEIHTAGAAAGGALTPEQIAKISADGDAERKKSKTAWDNAFKNGTEPKAWADLRMTTGALSKYLLIRMDTDAQKNSLAADAESLFKSKDK